MAGLTDDQKKGRETIARILDATWEEIHDRIKDGSLTEAQATYGLAWHDEPVVDQFESWVTEATMNGQV